MCFSNLLCFLRSGAMKWDVAEIGGVGRRLAAEIGVAWWEVGCERGIYIQVFIRRGAWRFFAEEFAKWEFCGNKEPGTIVQEIQKGYLMKDRLLRSSLVAVSKKPEKSEEKGEEKE